MFIITLSAIPPRFSGLEPALSSLLTQEQKPEAIRLYIPYKYRRFPEWDGSLPEVPKGVEIVRVDDDLGPATKVLFAADELRNEDVGILFCDDDHIYLPDWSRRLLNAWQHHPDAAIVTAGFDLWPDLGLSDFSRLMQPRARPKYKKYDLSYNWKRLKLDVSYGWSHGWRKKVPLEIKPARDFIKRSGYVDIGEGHGGFLVRPQWLGRDIWDIPNVMWAVDDVWLSGHLARKGVGIWAEAKASRFQLRNSQGTAALHSAVIDGATRDEANRACAIYMRDTYGVWGGSSARQKKEGDPRVAF